MDKRQWHRWFAWHPVFLGDRWAWLRMVERRRYGSIIGYDSWWIYR